MCSCDATDGGETEGGRHLVSDKIAEVLRAADLTGPLIKTTLKKLSIRGDFNRRGGMKN